MKCLTSFRNLIALIFIAALCSAPVISQVNRPQRPTITSRELKPRWVPPKPDRIVLDPKQAIAGVFVLKFVEGSHVRLGPNGLYLYPKTIAAHRNEINRLARAGLDPQKAAAQLAEVQSLLSTYKAKAGFKVDPLFQFGTKDGGMRKDRFAEKSKLEEVAREELADLELYYVVHAPNFKDIDVQTELMNRLNAFALVEQVHPDVPSSGAHVLLDVTSNQTYLNAAPAGLDGRFIWTRAGGQGENMKFVDVEFDWVRDHEDFPPQSNWFWGDRPGCAYDGNWSEHGTAVMGIVAAPANGVGVTGFAPNVRWGLASVCRPFDYLAAGTIATFSGENFVGRAQSVVVANAIATATSALGPGDVMLVEQHAPGPGAGSACVCNCGTWEYVPMEYYQESFDAISHATGANIIVIEAAANGGQNLDHPAYRGRFDRAIRDSRAILVGAAGPGDGKVQCFSSSSRRIDLYAWGSGVTTLGYGNGAAAPAPFNNTNIPQRYTQGFGGTSSAAAIVAGSIVSLQGARIGAGLPRLLPDQVRELLITTGTPQQDRGAVLAERPIGVQPDLRAAFQRSVSPASSIPAQLIGMDLPGGDSRSFATANDRGTQCSSDCAADPVCRAWTWVRPGAQRPTAMCWLKDTVLEPRDDPNTISGVSGIRMGQNLFGSDYQDFGTANDGGQQCLVTCLRDPNCRAWTWVRPMVQGPAARCWLKNAVPSFNADTNTNSSIVRP